MLCSWKSAGGWRIKIDDFKEKLKVNYALRDLKKKVLEPAKEELYNNQSSDIWFEYTTEGKQGGTRTRGEEVAKLMINWFSRYTPAINPTMRD